MRRIRFLVLFLCLCVLPWTSHAQHIEAHTQGLDYTLFSQFPIVHEGRVKPLGRVAQLTLKRIADVEMSAPEASAWMATLLMDPQGADTPSLFYVTNPHLRHALALPEAQDSFSFRDLNDAFVRNADLVLSLRDQPEQELQKDQTELLNLYALVTYYEQLRHALTLVLPMKSQDRFVTLKDTGTPALQQIAAQGEINQSFLVIPSQGTWLSPWAYWFQQQKIGTDDATPVLLTRWADLADAYIAHNPTQWQHASRSLYQETLAAANVPLLAYQLKAELLYHVAQPYLFSLCLYLAGMIAALALLKYPARPVYFATWIFFLSGLMCHIGGILCRMFILQRPPVSTLYESILFVGAMIMTAGLWYIHAKRETLLLPVLGILGVALQLLGFALNDDGDSLRVLQAVLDTKFWLATHVIIITCGYALCLLTSIMAHLALWVTMHKPAHAVNTHRFFKRSFYFSLLALLFVSIGTLLGGVWADQSWGRFWGWDPKENGALLIVLWLVWLLHGRLSRHFSERGFLVGLVLLSLVVGISWIGVNLLGIGLHSYGFINGSVGSLVVLCITELTFLGVCAVRHRRITGHTDHA